MQGTSQRKRIDWLEYAKGIGIFTVVAWHVNGGIINGDLNYPDVMGDIGDAWDVYTFRYMPIFFFISGIFVNRTLKRGTGNFITEKVRTLAYPYFVWSLITLIFGSAVAGYTNIGLTLRDFPQMIYEPVMHYWFLYALFVIFMLYVGGYVLKLSPWLLLGISLLMYVITDAFNVIEWSYVVSQIGYFAIVFVLGVMFGQQVILWVETRTTPVLLAVAVICCVILLVFLISGTDHVFVWIKGIVALVAMLGAFTLSAVLERGGLLRFVYHWGRYSLEIYLAHVLALAGTRIILSRFIGVENGMIHLIAGILAGLYLPLLLVWLTQKLHMDYLFKLPRSAKSSAVESPSSA